MRASIRKDKYGCVYANVCFYCVMIAKKKAEKLLIEEALGETFHARTVSGKFFVSGLQVQAMQGPPHIHIYNP